MKILTNYDLNKNQLQNAVIHLLATAPGSPTEGQIYYDTADHHLYVYNGTSFLKLLLTGEIVNADIASGAAIALSKLATDPLARANHTGTQAASTISDFDTQVRTNRLDQLTAPTSAVSFNGQRITSVGTPSSSTDAANKSYVDNLSAGLDPKGSVRATTTADITLSGAQTIDGVSIIAGDRVLVKDQSTGSENGIWVAAAGAWSRATDADSDAEVTPGLYVFVEEGTLYEDTGWVLSTDAPITVGTTALVFTQYSGGGSVTAGDGLTKTGNTLNIGTASSGRIVVNADNIDLASGIVTPGTYQSITVDTYGRVTGGTNPTTLSGYGITDATKKYSETIGNGSSTSIAVTHSLGSKEVVTQLRQASDDAVVLADVVNTDANNVTISFAVAPATNAIKVVVIG